MNPMNTKNHPLEQEELMAYLDGELRPELATIAAGHLEHCAECRDSAAKMREMSQQLAAWEIQIASADMPAGLSSAVDKHVKVQKKRVDEHRRSWRQVLGTKRLIWAGGATFAVLLVVAITVSNLVQYKSPARMSESLEVRDGNGAAQSDAKAPVPAPLPKPLTRRPVGSAGIGSVGKLEAEKSPAGNDSYDTNVDGQENADEIEKPQAPNGPMIVRTAELTLTTKDFDKARGSAEEILKRYGGYIGELTVNAPANSGRTLEATFRIPADKLDAAMAELKRLGRVESESQGGEEVTQQYVDLQARLANARHTEKRLSDLLSNRTGKLSDVLAFEKEIDRVRGEIESMEAQRKSLAKQVSYATLNTTMTEDYGQRLQVVPPSTSTRFRNAAVDGYRAVADGIVSLLLFLLSAGPSIVIWGGILFVIARVIWKRLRRRIA